MNQTDNKCEQKVESFVSTAFDTKMIISLDILGDYLDLSTCLLNLFHVLVHSSLTNTRIDYLRNCMEVIMCRDLLDTRGKNDFLTPFFYKQRLYYKEYKGAQNPLQ